ncbi:MAG TPA: ATP-binding protein [Blastocatellia bacterium]|nr:ATP-binding protein [Blastocatellia bacterium]
MRSAPTMSLLEILKLVGFATGAALHLYISWLIWNRRLVARHRLSALERTFLLLGLSLGVWFLGNVLSTLHGLLVGAERLTGWMRAWNTITLIGIAVLPSTLLHAHFAFWNSLVENGSIKARIIRLPSVVLYAPLLFLPYAVYQITISEYAPFFLKLRLLLVPYSVWYMLALWASAAIDWAIGRRIDAEAKRERTFFKRLALLLVVTGAFEFVVVGLRGSGPNDFLWVAFILLSLLPTFFVAYYVYRYKLVEVAIKDSLVYAAFAVVFIAVYTYGVRQVDQFLVERYQIKPGVIEVLLILGMVALARPVVRAIDQMVHRLFSREIGLYRDVVRQVSAGASGFGELDSLIRYTEQTIKQGLVLTSVKIIPFDSAMPDGPERRLAEKMIRLKSDIIESDEDLSEIGASAAYALWREGKLTGLMMITAEPNALTSEKRAILDVLAGQVAAEVETCRLVEEKVRLERALAIRERLATLGQMAATVAHEVKNPLSSIKSIAQVMREESALAGYDRDLGLIISEIDRLNRTVSQLLAFSRPANADPRPVGLRELIDSTVELLGGEARERGVEISASVDADLTLSGAQAAALREALSNLIVNAVQAAGRGDQVSIEASLDSHRATPRLIVSVTDTGPGIADEVQSRVFEPFFTTKSRGTGLGLAIVQRRVAELGGAVELTSPAANGRGTRFRIVVAVGASSGAL